MFDTAVRPTGFREDRYHDEQKIVRDKAMLPTHS